VDPRPFLNITTRVKAVLRGRVASRCTACAILIDTWRALRVSPHASGAYPKDLVDGTRPAKAMFFAMLRGVVLDMQRGVWNRDS
jgi:hypothetical protein